MKCAIPVFEGLLPEPHNGYLLKLLFNLAHWHGLAKLQIHTDTTLELLAQVMKSLGSNLRTFAKCTCSLFQTRGLECEHAAQQWRQEKDGTWSNNNVGPRKLKELSLRTYKYHALGDYIDMIKHFGTTDSYSTQGVSSQLAVILFSFHGIMGFLE